uniref:Uncharacterized protein n=1 Tax=viral metagenome TaxID=1070528 RepID=A0A6M3JHI6_9ZZZZ
MNKVNKEKHAYVFPDLMAKFMSKVSMQTQMESSMMSMFLIMIGMVLMVIYLLLFLEGSLFYKGLVVFNLLCGFLFISSFLVTTYQQYISYMNMMGIDPAEHKAEIRRRGNIFKRIYLAIKNRKKKPKKLKVKETEEPFERVPRLSLIDDALYNKEIIDKEREVSMGKLQEEAARLRKEASNINIIEKEVD